MKRLLLTLVVLLLVSTNALGQVTVDQSIDKGEIKNLVQSTINKLVEEGKVVERAADTVVKPRSIDDELKVVLGDLANFPEYEKPFQAYITFYHIKDRELLAKFYQELAFWVHSLSNESLIKAPQPVEGSSTLFRIDMRDYGWTQKAWEKVSTRESYIREPWIDHASYSVIRTESGNNLIRGDWFLSHTSSPVKQIDFGDKEILYETLLYAPLGRSPKNLQEYRDFWGYDINKIETKLHKVEQILVPHGKSGVARNNRILARVQTELGYFYSSSDFVNSTKERNVIENLYPDQMLHPNRDAGEHIGQNKIGLQHYLVTNAKDENVHLADAAVAFDRTDVRDVRVMAGKSCAICHSQGINIPYNGLQALLEKQVKLRYADKDFKLAADRTYFGPLSRIYDRTSERQTLMEKDRESYNDAVLDVTGIDAATNARQFKEVLDWYENDITLEQAALECGVTVEEFQDKVLRTASGRLGELANGGTVSRQEWEDVNNGYFAQSMLLLKSIGKTIIQTPYQNTEIVPQQPVVEEIKEEVKQPASAGVLSSRAIVVTKDTYAKVGKERIAPVRVGNQFNIEKIIGEWYQVRVKLLNGTEKVAYIHKSFVQEI